MQYILCNIDKVVEDIKRVHSSTHAFFQDFFQCESLSLYWKIYKDKKYFVNPSPH